jgi:hypothetical protein
MQKKKLFGVYLRKSASLETKKAEPFLTLPSSKSTPTIVSGPIKRSRGESQQRRGHAAIPRSATSFMAFTNAPPEDPYLFSNRMKYTLSLKICSGTSSFAQFMID